MVDRTFLGGSVLLLAAAAGCYTGGSVDPAAGSHKPPTTDVNGTVPTGDAAGIPCDVANVIATTCASCHGEPLAGGAPNRMLTYEDLTAASRTDPTRSVAQLSIERMQDAKTPMPPTGVAPQSDVAVLQAWVAAGTPQGTCTAPVAGPALPSEYDTPTVCTSNSRWTRGDRGSTAMHPGVACIECHDRGEGPSYAAAGTLYPTAHEPDDCNGKSGSGINVIITDATGKTYTLPVNSAGNFYTRTRFATPYRAKVVSAAGTREMTTPQTDGDCNTCHGEKGSQKAPGRVMAP